MDDCQAVTTEISNRARAMIDYPDNAISDIEDPSVIALQPYELHLTKRQIAYLRKFWQIEDLLDTDATSLISVAQKLGIPDRTFRRWWLNGVFRCAWQLSFRISRPVRLQRRYEVKLVNEGTIADLERALGERANGTSQPGAQVNILINGVG